MDGQLSFEFEQRKPIKGYPELHWTGKRPYTSTQYYPAQLKESFGEPKNGWMNKIFWGDNLQVMSHMLKDFRGKIDLIYIDPPFDSKADYKKKIEIKGSQRIQNDNNIFEEKQYGDIWTNDEYLQFLYERLIMMRELLSDTGSIFVHCDRHKSHIIRCLLDEVFGNSVEEKTAGLVNEIVWFYPDSPGRPNNRFAPKHDIIYWYSKTGNYIFNAEDVKEPILDASKKRYETTRYLINSQGKRFEYEGSTDGDGLKIPETVWRMSVVKGNSNQATSYPTQKPEDLIERIIKAASKEDSIVFDCFMGSGTTQNVAMKLGRRFIGADINLGAVQTTTKRIFKTAMELDESNYKGFEVYNVNNYDFFRNPVEAKELIIDALGIQKYDSSSAYDGELDGWMVKIMPTNRIATKADLEELKANLPYRTFEKRKEENPNGVVEKIRIICMGHEADLKASLEQELSAYKLEIEILDILRDKTDLQFKREADANVVKEGNMVVVKEFYPMNLLQKLSMQKESVEDWRQLVESIYIDWNYDGETMRPTVCDIPGKDELVSGVYEIPASATRTKIKITDLLSEALELEV